MSFIDISTINNGCKEGNLELIRYCMKYSPNFSITRDMFKKSNICIKKILYEKDKSLLDIDMVKDIIYGKYLTEEFIIWIVELELFCSDILAELFIICCENGYYDGCVSVYNFTSSSLDDKLYIGLNAAVRNGKFLIVRWILYISKNKIVDNEIILNLCLSRNLEFIKEIDETYGGSYDKKVILSLYLSCIGKGNKNIGIINWLKDK